MTLLATLAASPWLVALGFGALGLLAGLFAGILLCERSFLSTLEKVKEAAREEGRVQGQLESMSRRAVVRELFPQRRAK